MTITLKHEKSTRQYELFKSTNPIASIYIPKEEFHGTTVPTSISITVQFDKATPKG